MNTYAAVMTGSGTGAIATIQICGGSAKGVLEKMFKPATELNLGKIYVGTIADDSRTIDQVTIGCEGPDIFAINCHGNPLIVEQIMQLLQQQGVELITVEQLLARTFAGSNTIALEAKLTLPKVKTLEGTKIILNQIDSGLTAVAKKWLKSPTNQITAEAKAIIEASEIAKLIIYGCRIVLAGPPNTGKSTLLNRLAGWEKAIVTNIKGTTRDWVSADCRIGSTGLTTSGPLAVELTDTAGLNEKLEDDIDRASQKVALEIINQANLILLVLDNSEPAKQLTKSLTNRLANRKVLTVLNKSDLPVKLDTSKLPRNLASNSIQISALLGTGIDTLAEKICEITGVKNFDIQQPVCFTARQKQLLAQLAAGKSKDAAHPIITELLTGRLNV